MSQYSDEHLVTVISKGGASVGKSSRCRHESWFSRNEKPLWAGVFLRRSQRPDVGAILNETQIQEIVVLKGWLGMASAQNQFRGSESESSPGIATRPAMEKLLVIMTEHASVQKLMPCLETLARPGRAVIFLFQYPVDSRSYFRDHRITVESARHATAVARNIVHRYDWEAQKELAQEIIAPAVGALHNKGVQVEIHLYSGRLAKAIKNYSADKD